ncbi:MAG: SufE family protein [Calditrichaeota bacterium]|nr:MAG: SufE family protein [Calditrichota bacterium]
MSRLEEIVSMFESLEPEMKLELLLDYAEKLPPLPEKYHRQEALSTHRVPECMTPVALFVEVENGQVKIFAQVPPESPTVKGFISLLIDAFTGATPREVLEAPMDILNRSGLIQTIGMRRMNGLSAIYRRIKQEVARQLAEPTNGREADPGGG